MTLRSKILPPEEEDGNTRLGEEEGRACAGSGTTILLPDNTGGYAENGCLWGRG